MQFKILHGNALDRIDEIDDKTIQSIITSPPYFNLRSYSAGNISEIGRESNIEEYISNLVLVFRKLKNKLKDDGILFLNLGDTYIKGSLSGIPWRVALALIDDGWILRSDIIWHKPNAMPSSVKTRPTTDHEYVFMLTKNKNYTYYQDAIREPHVTFSEQSKMKGGRNHFGKKIALQSLVKTQEIPTCMMVGGIRHFILWVATRELFGAYPWENTEALTLRFFQKNL